MTAPGDGSMLAEQRRHRIVEEVARAGGARVSDLVLTLGVSDMTVRRDIAALAHEGRLRRVHGGAIAPMRSTEEPTLAQTSARRTRQKAAIAEAAMSRVRPGTCLALSAGSTTLALAARIARLPHAHTLTVLTNSLPAADVLWRSCGATVLLTGGERTPSDALVGPLAERSCHGLHTDVLFLGVHGMDAEAGPTTPNLREAQTTAALLATAGEVVVLADSSKWGVVGMSTLAPWSAVHTVITDAGLAASARTFLTETVDTLEITGS